MLYSVPGPYSILRSQFTRERSVSSIRFQTSEHRQPKLTLRAAHKLDCFFHAVHNNGIGTLCITTNCTGFQRNGNSGRYFSMVTAMFS